MIPGGELYKILLHEYLVAYLNDAARCYVMNKIKISHNFIRGFSNDEEKKKIICRAATAPNRHYD